MAQPELAPAGAQDAACFLVEADAA
jgi:hypothetical protein